VAEALDGVLGDLGCVDDLFGLFETLRGCMSASGKFGAGPWEEGKDGEDGLEGTGSVGPASALGVFVRQCLAAWGVAGFETAARLLQSVKQWRRPAAVSAEAEEEAERAGWGDEELGGGGGGGGGGGRQGGGAGRATDVYRDSDSDASSMDAELAEEARREENQRRAYLAVRRGRGLPGEQLRRGIGPSVKTRGEVDAAAARLQAEFPALVGAVPPAAFARAIAQALSWGKLQGAAAVPSAGAPPQVLPKAAGLRMQAATLHRDFPGALEGLHESFASGATTRLFQASAVSRLVSGGAIGGGAPAMQAAQATMASTSLGTFQRASLALGALHAGFGHAAAASRSLDEAVRVAQQDGDAGTLLGALVWQCVLAGGSDEGVRLHTVLVNRAAALASRATGGVPLASAGGGAGAGGGGGLGAGGVDAGTGGRARSDNGSAAATEHVAYALWALASFEVSGKCRSRRVGLAGDPDVTMVARDEVEPRVVWPLLRLSMQCSNALAAAAEVSSSAEAKRRVGKGGASSPALTRAVEDDPGAQGRRLAEARALGVGAWDAFGCVPLARAVGLSGPAGAAVADGIASVPGPSAPGGGGDGFWALEQATLPASTVVSLGVRLAQANLSHRGPAAALQVLHALVRRYPLQGMHERLVYALLAAEHEDALLRGGALGARRAEGLAVSLAALPEVATDGGGGSGGAAASARDAAGVRGDASLTLCATLVAQSRAAEAWAILAHLREPLRTLGDRPLQARALLASGEALLAGGSPSGAVPYALAAARAARLLRLDALVGEARVLLALCWERLGLVDRALGVCRRFDVRAVLQRAPLRLRARASSLQARCLLLRAGAKAAGTGEDPTKGIREAVAHLRRAWEWLVAADDPGAALEVAYLRARALNALGPAHAAERDLAALHFLAAERAAHAIQT